MHNFDGIIIGNGIASHVTLYFLSMQIHKKLNKNNEPKRLLIIESSKAKACSSYSTSHAGTINARDGISPLGDMIKQSYLNFCQFVEENRPDGIHRGTLYKSFDISDEVRPELNKRELVLPPTLNNKQTFYGYKANHHFIDADPFMNWLREKYTENFTKSNISITYQTSHIDNIVNSENGYLLSCDSIQSLSSPHLLLTTGSELFSGWLQKEWSYPVLTPRDGDYLSKNNMDLGEESFSIMIESTNVIYRHYSRELLIGGTTNDPDEYRNEPNHKELQFFYHELKKYYKELPAYESFSVSRGTRVRGPKRYPYFGEINNGMFALIGLYKNGFTFPFLLAPKLVDLMIQKNFLK